MKLQVNGIKVGIKEINSQKYISLTDIARKKNSKEPRFVVLNWLKNRNTVEFLRLWEILNNINFNRAGFDTVKSKVGLNSYTLSPSKWIELTNAIGIISKGGRYDGGTYAHEDIALEFATWISSEFKLYFIKEFRRLKNEENERLKLGWDVKRQLTKINYKIHTDAIKNNLIPKELKQTNKIYADEADILNLALFGKTAKEWRNSNNKEGNIRDYSNVSQLVCLANLETLNALFIEEKIPQNERLVKLNKLAINQMNLLINNNSVKKLS